MKAIYGKWKDGTEIIISFCNFQETGNTLQEQNFVQEMYPDGGPVDMKEIDILSNLDE
jgi:hypothetical protein